LCFFRHGATLTALNWQIVGKLNYILGIQSLMIAWDGILKYLLPPPPPSKGLTFDGLLQSLYHKSEILRNRSTAQISNKENGMSLINLLNPDL